MPVVLRNPHGSVLHWMFQQAANCIVLLNATGDFVYFNRELFERVQSALTHILPLLTTPLDSCNYSSQ